MPLPGGRITDPFAVVPDQPTATNQHARRPIPEGMVAAAASPPSEGGNKRPSAPPSEREDAAVSPSLKVQRLNNKDAASPRLTEEFGQQGTPDVEPNMELCMPQRVNLYEAGLRRSPRLIEIAQRKKAKQANAHVSLEAGVLCDPLHCAQHSPQRLALPASSTTSPQRKFPCSHGELLP